MFSSQLFNSQNKKGKLALNFFVQCEDIIRIETLAHNPPTTVAQIQQYQFHHITLAQLISHVSVTETLH
jgi:hypothetical protein